MKVVILKEENLEISNFFICLIKEGLHDLLKGEEFEIKELNGSIKECISKIDIDSVVVLFNKDNYLIVSKLSKHIALRVANKIIEDGEEAASASIYDLFKFIVDREECRIKILNNGEAYLEGYKE